MEEWKFVFEDNTEQKQGIDSGVEDALGSGANEKAKNKNKKAKKDFSELVTEKASDKIIEQTMISPLNTATGGLANPAYKVVKRLSAGETITSSMAGSLAVTVALIAIKYAINGIESRLQELQKQVTELNNADNALIRAGSVNQATYYNANIFGIKKTTNRS